MKNAASIKQLKYKVNKLGALLLLNNIFGLFCFVLYLSLSFCLSQTLRIFPYIPSFLNALSDDFCANVAIGAFVVFGGNAGFFFFFFFKFAAFCLLRNQKEIYSNSCTLICAYLFHLQMASANWGNYNNNNNNNNGNGWNIEISSTVMRLGSFAMAINWPCVC